MTNGESFMKQLALAAAVLALLSVTANAQIRQRQGATAAARRDEGVTLRPRLLWEGPASRRPFPFLGPPLACIKHRERHPDPAAASKMQISQRLSSSIRLYASHGMLFRHNPSCLRLIVGAERNPSYLQLLVVADQTGSPHSQNSIGCRERLSIVFAGCFWRLFSNLLRLGSLR